MLNSYDIFVIANVALLVIAGAGLNLLTGLAGLISFGHVGFFAIGAYTVAILTTNAGWSFWPAWALGAAIAAGAGALLAVPALRARGPYLAMITIAFGLIVEHALIEGGALTGGQNGIVGIPPLPLGGWSNERGVALVATLAALAMLGLYAIVASSAWGAALRAVRDSETAARSTGIHPLHVNVFAFAASAGCTGLAGGLFGPLNGLVTPESFGFLQSILFVLVVMLGGAGSIAGPLLGAIVVGLLPEVLASLQEYRLLFFGALLLVVLWIAPEGLAGLLTRRRAPGRAAVVAGREPAMPAVAPFVARGQGETLRAQGLTMVFGGVRAVDGVDLDARGAAITALIGPNGAGKSTVLNMLGGFYTPVAGSVTLGARNLTGLPAHRLARLGIARSYQTSQLFDSLSVAANIALALRGGALGSPLDTRTMRAAAVAERAAALLAWCGYRGEADAPAGSLAHVDRRLVEIARALALDPAVLLLDEPAAGLSREDKALLAGLLRRIAAAGVGVVLVEHDMDLVMGVSDDVVVLDAGRRIAAGTPAAIRDDEAVKRAYLGEPATAAPGAGKPARTRPSGHDLLGIGALRAGYGAGPILHGLNLSVRDGEAVALLGANGAGKSTLMRAIAGLHRPIEGGVHLDGTPMHALRAEQVVAQGLVLVPEGRQVFPELSVEDNILLGAYLHPEAREARLESMLDRFPRLRERRHQRAGLLSGGEQQMLAIARGLMAKPRVLLLDEPSLGLAPKVIAELFASFERMRDDGITLLIVDQMAALALGIADRAYVLERGELVAAGTPAEIAGDPKLARAYLGAA